MVKPTTKDNWVYGPGCAIIEIADAKDAAANAAGSIPPLRFI